MPASKFPHHPNYEAMLKNCIVSKTGICHGFGSSKFKWVSGLSKDERDTVRNFSGIVFVFSGVPATGKAGTKWRVVICNPAGNKFWHSVPPTDQLAAAGLDEAVYFHDCDHPQWLEAPNDLAMIQELVEFHEGNSLTGTLSKNGERIANFDSPEWRDFLNDPTPLEIQWTPDGYMPA